MKKIETKDITKWSVAKKTKNIRTKALINLMIDKTVTNGFLINTLEGREPLGDGSVVCLGEAGDIWQQMPKKLLAKYNPIDCDKDGWWICEPRPDNSANCVEVTETMLLSSNVVINKIKELMSENNEFYIIGQWGEQTEEGQIQKGKVGDFILQNREDPSDVWVVAKRFFNNTYNIISE